MKNKSQPNIVKSGTYLDQALMKGLTPEGRKWAKLQVDKFNENGIDVPYGMIRKMALEFKKKD